MSYLVEVYLNEEEEELYLVDAFSEDEAEELVTDFVEKGSSIDFEKNPDYFKIMSVNPCMLDTTGFLVKRIYEG